MAAPHMWVGVERAGTVADINDRDDLTLVNDLEGVMLVKEFTGRYNTQVRDFEGFFIKTEDGYYKEIYGFSGTVPYLSKPLYRITWRFNP